ncbi:hypothetical protein KFK09_013325 [Dendrobium nobile]|uniref:Uncharacterized protein n=1 Tax=Dendrobium nobile TaxID=94219 RepID=A0A8T3B710_DENNO|nr:hypothetical protein KFK09_013325 [Dendrobium nobile]
MQKECRNQTRPKASLAFHRISKKLQIALSVEYSLRSLKNFLTSLSTTQGCFSRLQPPTSKHSKASTSFSPFFTKSLLLGTRNQKKILQLVCSSQSRFSASSSTPVLYCVVCEPSQISTST